MDLSLINFQILLIFFRLSLEGVTVGREHIVVGVCVYLAYVISMCLLLDNGGC